MAIANISGNILTDSGVSTSSLVSGSGTTSYVPKFTGTSTLGNSLIYDNGTNIGIGTNNPSSSKLQIVGDWDYNTTNNTQITIQGSTNGNQLLRIGYSTTGDFGFIAALLSGTAYKPLVLQPNVGGPVIIGTTTDNGTGKLQVANNAAGWGGQIYNSNNGSQVLFSHGGGYGLNVNAGSNASSSTYLAAFVSNSTDRFYITGDGKVGIATNAPSGKLQIEAGVSTEAAPHILLGGNGYSGFHWINNTGYYFGQNSQSRDLRIYSGNNSAVGVVLNPNATSWTGYSDERLKTNIEQFDNVLDNVLSLRTIKYHFKDVDAEDSQKRYGLIAQDLVGKFDEVLSTSKFSEEDETEYLGVRYTELIPVLIKAIQELSAKVSALENKS